MPCYSIVQEHQLEKELSFQKQFSQFISGKFAWSRTKDQWKTEQHLWKRPSAKAKEIVKDRKYCITSRSIKK